MSDRDRISTFFQRVALLSTGDKAALRRALGKTMEQDGRAYLAFLAAYPSQAGSQEADYFLAACVACFYERHRDLPVKTFAECLHACAQAENGGEGNSSDTSQGMTRRFSALLAQRDEASAVFVQKISRLIRMCRQRGYRVDWEALLSDLLGWKSEKRPVQRRWAKVYIGTERTGKEPLSQEQAANEESQEEAQ